MAHTPGPWVADKLEYHALSGRSRLICGAGDDDAILALCFGWTGDPAASVEAEANAHLIAAAPDLLAACKAMLEMFSAGNQSMHCVQKAFDAVAKAEGAQ